MRRFFGCDQMFLFSGVVVVRVYGLIPPTMVTDNICDCFFGSSIYVCSRKIRCVERAEGSRLALLHQIRSALTLTLTLQGGPVLSSVAVGPGNARGGTKGSSAALALYLVSLASRSGGSSAAWPGRPTPGPGLGGNLPVLVRI